MSDRDERREQVSTFPFSGQGAQTWGQQEVEGGPTASMQEIRMLWGWSLVKYHLDKLLSRFFGLFFKSNALFK